MMVKANDTEKALTAIRINALKPNNTMVDHIDVLMDNVNNIVSIKRA